MLKKSLKKSISLLLTLIICMSVAVFAFADTAFTENSHWHEITKDEAEAKYNNGDTFIFMVYRTTCSNCEAIGTNVVTPWMNNYSADVYGMNCDSYYLPSWANEALGYPSSITLPVVAFVKNKSVTIFSGYQPDELNSAFEAFNAHTHSYTSEVTTAATCTTAGVRTYTCSCGDSYTEVIPALGHIDANSDCICDRCGAEACIITHTHSYTAEVTTAATCTTAGVRTYTCSCGDSYTEVIPALGHIDANSDNICDRCSEIINKSQVDTINAILTVPSDVTVAYNATVTIKVSAVGVPQGYSVAIFDGGYKLASGTSSAVYTTEKLTASKTYTARIIKNSTNSVASDLSWHKLEKEININVKTDFFSRIVAFFRGLFNMLPSVTIG